MRRDLLRILGVGLICVGLSGFGWKAATIAGEFGQTNAGVETLTRNGTVFRTHYETIKRKVNGRVITLPGGTKVVRVPAILVHTGGHVIRVPAHNLKIHKVDRGLISATVAEPSVPVTVTVFVPSEPVTVTATDTSTVTTWVPTTITVTVTAPLATTGDAPE